jgi:hydroxypyruvate isomerase
MPVRFDANLSILFTELPLLERFDAAAAAGFDSVELWWPFDGPEPTDAEVTRLVAAVRNAGVQVVGLNLDAGDMSGGERGLVCRASQADRFRRNVPVAVALADSLGCHLLNALYGNIDPDSSDELAVENLGYAAAEADKVDARIMLEALNSYDCPRYPLLSTRDSLEVIERVHAATGYRLGLLYDVYHMHRMQEDVTAVVSRHLADIAHVQVADDPGRHEPGTGAVDFSGLFDALKRGGYAGRVGLEYKPAHDTVGGLGWLAPYQPREAQ